MSESPLAITALNDFVFCPVSIYFHGLYGDSEQMLYQVGDQIDGKNVHKSIDAHSYTTSRDILQGIDVYCEEFNLIGKIDLFRKSTGALIERKKKVTVVYDGYVFQLFAQCFALREMGFFVKSLTIHSYDDNKNYPVALPEDSPEMLCKFKALINSINEFDVQTYMPKDESKCARCIYKYYCDRSLSL